MTVPPPEARTPQRHFSLGRATATIGGYTLLSRLLGFVRDILIAALVGAGVVTDAFFIAFKFPNLFRRLFAEGAFNSGFVPVFNRILHNEGDAAAKRFAEDALAALVLTAGITTAVFELAMPVVMVAFAPGWIDDPVKYDLAVTLARITFPYLLLVSVVSLLGAVLNSIGRFAAVAATPILLNLDIIAALVAFGSVFPTKGHALAVGVSAAGVVQLIWLYVVCARAGWSLKPRLPRWTPRVRELFRLMLPGVFGSGVAQINIAVDTVIASLLATGAVSYLFYADRLVQLPLGVIGVALGTALLPILSRHLGAGNNAAANHDLNRGIEISLLLGLPAAVALVIAPGPIVTVLFQRGEFDATAAHATALAVAASAVGLPAYVLTKVLAPAFYARHDTRTPVKIATAALVLNTALNLWFVYAIAAAWALAFATALSAWLNVVCLWVLLRRRGHFVMDERLRKILPRLVLACAAMGGSLWFGTVLLAPMFASGTEVLRLGGLALLIGDGLAVFALLAHFTGAANLRELGALIRAKQ